MKTLHPNKELRLIINHLFSTYFVSLITSALGRDDDVTICACSRSRPVRSLSSSVILIGYKRKKQLRLISFFNRIEWKRGRSNQQWTTTIIEINGNLFILQTKIRREKGDNKNRWTDEISLCIPALNHVLVDLMPKDEYLKSLPEREGKNSFLFVVIFILLDQMYPLSIFITYFIRWSWRWTGCNIMLICWLILRFPSSTLIK
jgi:hypothetical protein